MKIKIMKMIRSTIKIRIRTRKATSWSASYS
jgi:hypothetical protein